MRRPGEPPTSHTGDEASSAAGVIPGAAATSAVIEQPPPVDVEQLHHESSPGVRQIRGPVDHVLDDRLLDCPHTGDPVSTSLRPGKLCPGRPGGLFLPSW